MGGHGAEQWQEEGRRRVVTEGEARQCDGEETDGHTREGEVVWQVMEK